MWMGLLKGQSHVEDAFNTYELMAKVGDVSGQYQWLDAIRFKHIFADGQSSRLRASIELLCAAPRFIFVNGTSRPSSALKLFAPDS